MHACAAMSIINRRWYGAQTKSGQFLTSFVDKAPKRQVCHKFLAFFSVMPAVKCEMTGNNSFSGTIARLSFRSNFASVCISKEANKLVEHLMKCLVKFMQSLALPIVWMQGRGICGNSRDADDCTWLGCLCSILSCHCVAIAVSSSLSRS